MAAATLVVTSESFVNISTPEEMGSLRTRLTVAAHSGRVRRLKRRRPATCQPEKIVQSFHTWRVGSAPSLRRDSLQSSNNQAENTGNQQAVAAIGHVLDSVPVQSLSEPLNMPSLSPDPEGVLGDLDPFLTLPVQLTRSGQMLLCIATNLFTTSTTLGSSPLCARRSSLPHTFQSPMKLYNLLAATSAYFDACFRHDSSTETDYWRLRCIIYQNQLFASPSTRYGFESMAGIIGSTVMNALGAEEGCHMHAHALWQMLRHRRSHHMSFVSEAEDIYVFLQLISLSKRRSDWLRVKEYATPSVAEEWTSDHNFCLGVLNDILNWTTSMRDRGGTQRCVPASLRPLLNECTLISRDTIVRSQQLWLLSYLTLISYEYRKDFEGASRFSDMLAGCFAEAAHSDGQLPDMIYLLYKNSDTHHLTKWQALRLVEALQCLSDWMLAKVVQLFARILQDGATVPPERMLRVDNFTRLSNQILRFSTPIHALLGS